MIAGYQMQGIAQGYLVYQMTGSAKILTIVAGSSALPVLGLALVGGAVADRLRPKILIQSGQTFSTIAAIFIAVSIMLQTITWKHLVFIALLQGIIWSFQGPARQALLPQILDRDKISNAIALISAGMSAPALIAPAIAGLIYALVGPEGVYFMVAGLGVLAVMFSTSIHVSSISQQRNQGSIFTDMRVGLSYIWDKDVVRSLLILGFVFIFFSAPLPNLLPVLIMDVYGRQTGALGLLVSMSGIGALAGTLVIASLPENNRGSIFIGAGFTVGITSLMIALLPYYGVGLVIMVGFGFGSAVVWSLNQVLIMSHVEDSFRGRVMSIFMINFGLTPLAILPAGLLVDLFGITRVLVGVGILVIGFALVIAKTSNHIRSIQ
jgi:MFS family permease